MKNPVFNACQENMSLPTDPGVETRNVSWTVPTAVDWTGNPAKVTVKPPEYVPPVTFTIGTRTIEYIATDAFNLTASCRFSVEIKGLFPVGWG